MSHSKYNKRGHSLYLDSWNPNAKKYINRILELVGGSLGVLSVGPARETTLRINI